jgi:hypothetical protein
MLDGRRRPAAQRRAGGSLTWQGEREPPAVMVGWVN